MAMNRVEGDSVPEGTQTEFAPLRRVMMKHPKDAFVDEATIEAQWRRLGFSGPPDLTKACEEFDALVRLLEAGGAEVHLLPRNHGTTLDAIYARDAAVVCDRGVVLCRMGKPARASEPAAQEGALARLAPAVQVLGRIEAPGTLEGGDVAWLDARTLAVGRGYRTNAEGIRQLRALLAGSIDELIEVPLPHWRGPGDVMHLMSLISPADRNLAVVYSPLLPVPFRELLLERGTRLVEVPDEEFETMGTNVLAVKPGVCVMMAGNPRTLQRLQDAGAVGLQYEGREISVKGAGGPTCLTRPLRRG
jgi:N-dimethylarginine dimethylaminohydrolase